MEDSSKGGEVDTADIESCDVDDILKREGDKRAIILGVAEESFPLF